MKLTDQDFIETFRALGAAGTAKRAGMNIRNVHGRRRNLERKLHIVLKPPTTTDTTRVYSDLTEHPERKHLNIKDGIVLVGSDAHYWPGYITTAHRAFVHFCKTLRPKAVVMNGDELDGASISRHPPIGWESRPSLVEEIETVGERLDEIYKASKGSHHIWPLGNHDGRLETRIATVAPEFARVHGVHLKDHFPEWDPCWSVWINDDVVIKHRFKNGIHATHTNTVNAGKSIVTGHLHSLKVTPFTDYNGTRYGVDCGTLAYPYGPQFRGYMEDNPRSWRSGFAVLTFKDSKLLWPEVVFVRNEAKGEVEFRGEVIRV